MKQALKNKYTYIVVSVLLSLFLHALLLTVLMKVNIFPEIARELPREQTRKIELVPFKPRKKDVVKQELPSVTGPEDEKPPELPDDLMNDDKIPGAGGTIDTGSKINDGEMEIDIPEPPAELNTNPKLPSIVSVDGDSLPKDRLDFNRNMIPRLPRFDDAGISSLIPKNQKGDLGHLSGIGMRISLPPPKKKGMADLPTTMETRLIPDEPAVTMDPLVDVKIYKYPLPRGGGFFRIDISPNKKSEAMGTFYKDVIFLVDESGSIGSRRLAEFKLGLENSLKYLKPKDRLNIVAFKSRHYPLFQVPMHPTRMNLRKADAFIFKMTHGGSTNIYSALDPYVGKKNRIAARPLIIFLLSDGRCNAGAVVDNRELINKISNSNHNGAAIYSYSCGEDRNSFLMDLLAYRNRGESLNVPDIKGSNKELTRIIAAVSDVRVADLEYQISSDLADAAFPKRLPNLYKGKTLSIYGYYTDETKGVGLRITGRDASGLRREVVFGDSLKNALPAGPELARKWALQYIYHLYSLLSVRYDKKITDEIHNVAARYHLQLPYLDKHLVPRRKNYMR